MPPIKKKLGTALFISLLILLLCLIQPVSAITINENTIFRTSSSSCDYHMGAAYTFTGITVYSDALKLNTGNITTTVSSGWIKMSFTALSTTQIDFTNNVSASGITIGNGFASFPVTNGRSYPIYRSTGALYTTTLASDDAISYTDIPAGSWYIPSQGGGGGGGSSIGSGTIATPSPTSTPVSTPEPDEDGENEGQDRIPFDDFLDAIKKPFLLLTTLFERVFIYTPFYQPEQTTLFPLTHISASPISECIASKGVCMINKADNYSIYLNYTETRDEIWMEKDVIYIGFGGFGENVTDAYTPQLKYSFYIINLAAYFDIYPFQLSAVKNSIPYLLFKIEPDIDSKTWVTGIRIWWLLLLAIGGIGFVLESGIFEGGKRW